MNLESRDNLAFAQSADLEIGETAGLESSATVHCAFDVIVFSESGVKASLTSARQVRKAEFRGRGPSFAQGYGGQARTIPLCPSYRTSMK